VVVPTLVVGVALAGGGASAFFCTAEGFTFTPVVVCCWARVKAAANGSTTINIHQLPLWFFILAS
jgi:hypothetical protein